MSSGAIVSDAPDFAGRVRAGMGKSEGMSLARDTKAGEIRSEHQDALSRIAGTGSCFAESGQSAHVTLKFYISARCRVP